MAWKLSGTYFETCSCEVVCPCTASLALGADYDRCRVTLVFNIVNGRGDVVGDELFQDQEDVDPPIANPLLERLHQGIR